MTRIEEERQNKLKWKLAVCERVDEILTKREERVYEYITRPTGSPRYEVTFAENNFVVDIGTKHCSCGLWQLEGKPYVHAVCVYKSQNKDPRKYVHKDFLMTTWFTVYSHFLEPLRGPMFWTKSLYPDILPPDIRVLPRKPKRCRTKDVIQRMEEAEK
ncbi:hypothetical protein LIER_33160 [Lithospermum erythrorhizon]|uniref:Zinc finger PMZ-type domain-containing protein n=1 Tax=Lithospermum erythrorhizon TaxID=34254 RepID=A0AAV3RXA4_LITER